MRVGLVQTPSALPDSEPGDAVHRFVRIAVRAEELGYWSVWSTEHHFGSDRGYRPHDVSVEEYVDTDYDMASEPMMLLSYVAAQTTRLKLGTAVAILHWDHPIRVLERAVTLDALSGGRVELGVGRGAGFREQILFDVPLDQAVNYRKFYEMIQIVREGWSGEEFEWKGEFFDLPKLIIRPKPVQKTAPIWVGSAGIDSAIWAAEQGLPYATITWPLTEIDMYREKRDRYRAAAAAAGHDVSGNYNPHVVFFYCGETDEEAAEVAYKHMVQFQYINEHHYEHQRQHATSGWQFGAGTDIWQSIDFLARFPVEHHIVGSPETCRRRMEFFRDELDVNYMLFNVGYGLMPEELTMASLERFSQHVMPHFAEEPALVDA
jgi:alkanesulfonate monooxygenase SsuD/methylene tetrahydromethanopterin reductase-like flavin-dependent oxidoreductase (luciferase family)